MYITHVQGIGPFLRIFGQLSIEQANQVQANIDVVVAIVRAPPPRITELPVDTICLARFMGGKQYRRARIIGHRPPNEVNVQFIDFGNECFVKIHEVRLLNFHCPEIELLQTIPTQASPFILTGICCEQERAWTAQQLNELNADLCGQSVLAYTDAELGGFTFIHIIWKNENLVNYLVHIKQFGKLIPLEKQQQTFYGILTNSRGITPVRQLRSNETKHIQTREPYIPPSHVKPMHTILSPPLMKAPQVVRMPYHNIEISPNQLKSKTPKRSVVTFKSNTLMVGSFYDVYCCFVENGPCLFSVHLNSSEEELNVMMNQLESIPLKNLTDRPSIGMACVARFSEDNQLYRAVILTIKPTACQVAYVDYGNTEVVPFANLYEIPVNLLDQKIFAIRFALSGYKELEPFDDAIKNAFKDMVLHKSLQLKVMPLEGPPLVQYCELYDDDMNILRALKLFKNKQLCFSKPPPLYNNDMVLIRYVESPKKFFIQKVANIRGFDQMMDDLFLHCTSMKMTLQSITKGSACAVKFENAWYRAEILAVNQNRVSIRHVDFGNERNVDSAQLCPITERLVQFPVQATKCCLKGFEGAESLSESATIQLEMLAENADGERRHFKCQVFQMEDDGMVMVNLIDETIRPELNLMKKLYKLSMPFNKYIDLEKDVPPFQSNVNHKPVDDHIQMPPIFNSTTLNHDDPTANNHLAHSDWDAKSAASSDTKESPSEQRNVHSYQQSKENNSGRRFRDQREPPYNTFNKEKTNLPPRFQKQHEENRKMKENLSNNTFESRANNSFESKHTNSHSDSYTPHSTQKSPSQHILPPVASADEWDDDTAKFSFTSPPILNAEEYVPLNFKFKRDELIMPIREEIILCWWVSPHQFYTHNMSRTAEFENMMREIQKFYKNKMPAISLSIEVGASVIARFQKDKVLYRATILACNESLRKYRVEFVDFGNQTTITNNDIWQIEKRFAELPVMAQLCSFDGVVSNRDHKEITSNVEKYLKPGLKLYCNYLRKENNLYYAEIQVENRSLKDSLIEDGSLSSVEPDLDLSLLKGQQIRVSIVSVKDLLNFQIEIGGCNLKLMSSYNDIKFIKSNEHLSRDFKNNYEGNTCIAQVVDVSKEKILMLQPIVPLFTDDLPQRVCEYPIIYRTFNVKVVYVETENILYAHSVNADADLAELLDEMYNYYSEQGTPLDNFSPGTLCAALSSDGNWYRARIINSQNTSSNEMLEVYYIDYGNTEIIDNEGNLKNIEDEFCNANAIAIRFYFPIKSNLTENSTIDTIKSLTDGYELTLNILDRYKDCWIADIQSNGHSLINVLKDDLKMTQGIDIEHVQKIIDNDSTREMCTPVIKMRVSPKMVPSSEPVQTASAPILATKQTDLEIPNNMISAYLSHCDNPGRFFLHLTETYHELEKLQDNIQIVAGSLPALMTSVTGALCIALYTVDETWYRARIIDSEISAVQFIDYGNTDVLTDSSYMKEMNEAFENIPPFAIPCALPISPRNTADWVDEANDIFNTAYEKEIFFDYITMNAKKNYVNLKIDDENMVDKLIADGIARKLEVLKSGEEGFVSHTNNLSDFYIQMSSYADGLELIADHLAGFENFPVLKDSSVGVVCAAIFPEDSSWYRAKILSQTNDGTEVLFIDYGNTAITNELREISIEIGNLPFLSKKCSLRMPDYILGWSDAAEAKFIELSAMGETVFVVELIEPSDHAIIDLYIEGRNILEDLEPLCDKRPKIDIDLSSSMGIDDFTPNNTMYEANLKEVIISHVNAPTDFYIQLQLDRPELDEITDKLNSDDAGKVVETPDVNMICSASYDEDGSYYRAKILSIDEADGCEVFFIDFGNICFSKDLRILPDDLRMKPGLAYNCTLDQNGTVDLFSQSAINDFFTFTTVHECEKFEADIISRTEEPWIISLVSKGVNIYNEMVKSTAVNAQPGEVGEVITSENYLQDTLSKSTEKKIGFKSDTEMKEQDKLDTATVVNELLNSAINTSLEVLAPDQISGNQDCSNIKTVVNELIVSAINSSLERVVPKEISHEQDKTNTAIVVSEILSETINTSLETTEEQYSFNTSTVGNELGDSGLSKSFETVESNEISEEQDIANTATVVNELVDSAITKSLKTVVTSEEVQNKANIAVNELVDSAITKSLKTVALNEEVQDKANTATVINELISDAVNFSLETVTPNQIKDSSTNQTVVTELISGPSLEASEMWEDEDMTNMESEDCLERVVSKEISKDHDKSSAAAVVSDIIDCAMNASLKSSVPNVKSEHQDHSNTATIVTKLTSSTINANLEKSKEQDQSNTVTIVNGLLNSAVNASLDAAAQNKLNENSNAVIATAKTNDPIGISEKDAQSCTFASLPKSDTIIRANEQSNVDTSALNKEQLKSKAAKIVSELKKSASFETFKTNVNTTLEVVVTHVNAPTDFYIRLVSEERDLNEINKRLKEASQYDKLIVGDIGTICAALCPIKNTYYRAKILSIENDGFNVELIDIGNRLDCNDLRILPNDLQKKSALAKHCALETNCKSMTESFKSLVSKSKKLQMTMLGRLADPWIVSLSVDAVDLLEHLAGLEVLQPEQEMPRNEIDDNLSQKIIKDGMVSHANSPNDFYIQLSCDIKNLEKITEILIDSEDLKKQTDPKIGMLYAAEFPDDGAFYRAKILSINENSCEVLFVDFGNISISGDIRILPDTVAEFECIAKQCALENMTEIDFWTESASEIFNSLITSHIGTTFDIEIVSDSQEPWIVKLFNKNENLCDELTKLINEQNLYSQESSDVWEEAKDSSAAIITSDIMDNLIDDSIHITNGVCESMATNAENARSNSNLRDFNEASTVSTDSNSESPLTSEQLATQLWKGLHKLDVTVDSNVQKNTRASSTSNLCENNMKTANSVAALLSVEKDPTRSKSVECVNANN